MSAVNVFRGKQWHTLLDLLSNPWKGIVCQDGEPQWVAGWAFGAESRMAFAIGTLAAFPFVSLGALASEGAWAPLAIGRVLRSVGRLWWAWGLFYVETTLLIVGWVILTIVGLGLFVPAATPFYACPMLAAVILIYARLLGRLARLIGEEEENEDEET